MRNLSSFKDKVNKTIAETLASSEIAPFIQSELNIAKTAEKEFTRENYEKLGLTPDEIANFDSTYVPKSASSTKDVRVDEGR